MTGPARTCLFLCLLIPSLGSAQDRVSGSVRDSKSGQPLAGVTVRVIDGHQGTTTDSAGRFEIVLEAAGDVTLSFRLLGYRPDERRIGIARLRESLSVDLEEEPIRLGATVVTAARREQSLLDVPVSVSTLDAAALSHRISVTLEEPLRYVPGVHMMDDQVNIRGSSGYSRGVGSRVLLLMDGLPLLTGDTGEIIWEMVPVDQIDKVEVVKGSGSSLYGSSALGGVINIIPSRIPSGLHALARLQGGVYGKPAFPEWRWTEGSRALAQGSVMISHGEESWSSLLSLSRWMDESHRKNDVTHRYAVYNRSSLRLDGETSLELLGHYVHRVGGNFFWWKSLRSPLVPPDEYANRWVRSDRGFIALTMRTVHSSHLLSSFRLQYFGNAWSDEDAGVITTEARSGRLFGEGQLTVEVSDRHHIVAGMSGYLDRVRSNIFGAHPGVGFAGFVQDEYSALTDLTISAGLRLDWQRVSGLKSGSKLDPRIGLTYRLAESTALRASVATGFRYPSIGELYTSIATGFGGVNVVPNVRLRPEKSSSIELGAHHALDTEGAIDVAVFQTRYEELIEARVDPQELVIRFENVERAEVRGIEVSGEYRFFDRSVSLRPGYTYIDPRNLTDGTVLRFRPRHIFVASTDAESGPLTASLEYRYISRIEQIDENLVNVANIADGRARTPIHVLNARFSFTSLVLAVPLRLGIEVRNVGDYQYVELLANIAPPRTFLVSLETIF